MSAESLLLFVAAGLVLNLTPGPDVLFIVSHALRAGRRAGIVAACGITLGVFVHIAAAALGVGALMATSATAFTVLKWVGGAYLVYIGVRALLARAPQPQLATPAGAPRSAGAVAAGAPLSRVFWSGFATNALNPKVALFFLAFLPQFIDPAAEHKALAFAALGLLFNFNSLWVNIGWALAAARLARARWMSRGLSVFERAAGLLFIGVGLRLAFSDNASR